MGSIPDALEVFYASFTSLKPRVAEALREFRYQSRLVSTKINIMFELFTPNSLTPVISSHCV